MSKKLLWYVILALFCCSTLAYVATSGGSSVANVSSDKIAIQIADLESVVAAGRATPEQVAKLAELRAMVPTTGERAVRSDKPGMKNDVKTESATSTATTVVGPGVGTSSTRAVASRTLDAASSRSPEVTAAEIAAKEAVNSSKEIGEDPAVLAAKLAYEAEYAAKQQVAEAVPSTDSRLKELDQLTKEMNARKMIEEDVSGLAVRVEQLERELGINRTGNSSLDATGDNCTDPLIISSLPYTDANTTCGRVNDYSTTCMGSYDGGEDIIYRMNFATATNIQITMNPGTYTWTGIAVGTTCPLPASGCLWNSAQSGAAIHTSPVLALAAATNYYIMLDTYPTPTCFPFTLSIVQIQTGRCCYGNPAAPTCTVETSVACAARADDIQWTQGLDCSAGCPVYAVGRCCYGSLYTPSCTNEPEIVCLARANDINWTAGIDCGTACPALPCDVTPPYSMGFEAPTVPPALPDCWTQQNVDGQADKYWKTLVGGTSYPPHSGLNEAWVTYSSSTGAADDWLFTPPLTLTDGQPYSIEYWYRAYFTGYTEWLEVKVGTAANAASMTTTIDPAFSFTGTATWASHALSFTPDADGSYYIGIHYLTSVDAGGVLVDDFSIAEGEFTGRCCYLDAGVAACDILTLADCEALSGEWTNGITDCLGANACPVGRCCYGDFGAPECADETELECLARADEHEWNSTLTCASIPACPVMLPGQTCVTAIPVSVGLTTPVDVTGTTCGMVDDCGSPGEDMFYEVTVLDDGAYTFSLCNPGSADLDDQLYLYADGQCCGTALYSNDYSACPAGNAEITCATLTAGTYYLSVDGWYSGCGAFELTIIYCSVGKCCYGTPAAPSCEVVTESACLARTDEFSWTEGEDCTVACDPVPTGRCCYAGTPLVPLCAIEAESWCLARTNEYGWEAGVTDCLTDPCLALECVPNWTLTDAGEIDDPDGTCADPAIWNDGCLGYYDGGQENIIEWTVTAAGTYSIVLATTTTYTGMALATDCAAVTGCIAQATNSVAGGVTIPCTSLEAGTYYIFVDTYPSPYCIGAYTVTVEACLDGRCCYGDPWALTCEINDAMTCAGVGGDWLVAEDCTTAPCVNPCTVAPANDVCADVTPDALVIGTPLVYAKDMTCALANDCADPLLKIVWEAFTTTECTDVTLNYAGSDGLDIGTVYIDLATDCACTGFIGATSYVWNTGENPTVLFRNLPAGTYYVPIHPDRGPNYDLAISAVACAPGRCCYGTPSALLCEEGELQPVCLARVDYLNWTEAAVCPCPAIVEGDGCAFPFVLTVPSTVTGSTVGFVNDYDATCPYSGGTAPDVVYSYTAPEDQQVTFSLCNSLYDTKIYMYDTNCGVDPVMACNDDACGDDGYKSELSCVALLSGHTYYVVVDGYGTNSGTYTLETSVCIPCPAVCPPEGIAEGEVTCFDEYDDVTNGGCNSVPPVFGAIECDQTICGTLGTFLFTDAGTVYNYRDMDWYLLTLTAPKVVTWSMEADFAKIVWIFQPGTPDPCTTTTLVSASTPRCETATVTTTLAAGDYYLVAAPSVFEGIVCGTPYTAALTCVDPPTGKCCYFGGESCAINTSIECEALSGVWTEGLDCSEACTPMPPCPISFTSCASEYITNVTIQGINNTTGPDCPYGNYYYLRAQAEPGIAYPLEITVYNNATYAITEYVSVLVDWNLNHVWDLSTELVNVGTISIPATSPYTFTTMLLVPADAALGTPWMRVIVKESSYTTTGCDAGYYGEAEDYGLIVGPIACDPITDLTVISQEYGAVDTLRLHWTVLQNTIHKLYYTTNPNNDGNPDGGADPDFSVINLDILPIGPASYPIAIDGSIPVYMNYVVAAENCGPTPPDGRCCYNRSECVITTNADCLDNYSGIWTYGLTCASLPACGAYCTPCYSQATSFDDWIENVTFNTLNYTSVVAPTPCKYDDQTALTPTSVTQGASYTISVTINGDGAWDESCTAWFDWNADGIFSASEGVEVGCASIITANTPVTISTSVTVPVDATIGTTRMRVSETYSSECLAYPTPCQSATFGESEDFTIEIVAL